MGFGLEQNFSLFFRFDYDRKLLETAIQNEIQMKEIMKTFNTALQGIKGKYNNTLHDIKASLLEFVD